jgi:hypothetical protein
MCDHPFSSLSLSSTDIAAGGTVTIKLCCKSCGVPLTKQFLGRTPEPAAPVFSSQKLISDREEIAAQ